jgi:hypothetical protein
MTHGESGTSAKYEQLTGNAEGTNSTEAHNLLAMQDTQNTQDTWAKRIHTWLAGKANKIISKGYTGSTEYCTLTTTDSLAKLDSHMACCGNTWLTVITRYIGNTGNIGNPAYIDKAPKFLTKSFVGINWRSVTKLDKIA